MKALFATQNSFGIFILRVFLGIMFMAHGSQKLFGFFDGPGISGFAASLAQMGLPNPALQAYLASASEFLGGLLLFLGCLTRLAVIPPFVVMVVAITKVHWSGGFFLQNGGFEYPFIICGALFALLTLGGGAFSVDQKLSSSL